MNHKILKKGWFKRQYELAVVDMATWPQWMKDRYKAPKDCTNCNKGQLHYQKTDPNNSKELYQCNKCGKLELIA